jgi:hypothetical protein
MTMIDNELDEVKSLNQAMYNLLTRMRQSCGVPQELIEQFFDVTEEYEQRQKESQ